MTRSALGSLSTFSRWTAEHKVAGVIGEVGWPAGSQWAKVAHRWGEAAKDANLPVYVWGAAPWWQESHPLAFYRGRPGAQSLSLDSSQARDFEDMSDDGLVGGVGLAEASFGADLGTGTQYSAAQSGRVGHDYTYPTRESLEYLKGRGINRVRLAITWERLQQKLSGPLDAQELAHLRSSLQAAGQLGMEVVLDLHNYGRYAAVVKGERQVLVLGDSRLTAKHLADLWRRLARTFRSESAVKALGVMNEPHDLPGGQATWKAASLAATHAIRSVNRDIPVWVGGYDWSYVSAFNQAPWIPSTLGPVVYEAHQYFDVDHSGTYRSSYEETDRALAATGVVTCHA